jgi:hypothetical protein
MRQIILSFALSLTLFADGRTVPSAGGVQNLPQPEVSGVVNMGGNRVVLVTDEGYQAQVVSEAEATFKAGDLQRFKSRMSPLAPVANGSKDLLDDIEDVAWDETRRTLFLITSHSRSKRQTLDRVPDAKTDKPVRHKLARLVFSGNNTEPSHQEVDTLEDALRKVSFISAAMKKLPLEGGDTGGFNIEGLAFVPETGALLIGLRSPTQPLDGQSCAVVLTLKNPHALFDSPAAAPDFDPQPKLLKLGGLGLRGMTYDAQRKGVWLVAGRSADPDQPMDKTPSALWFWDLSAPGREPRRVQAELLGLESLEGVCLLKRDGKDGLLLVSDDGGDSNGSRYLWIPVPSLSGGK